MIEFKPQQPFFSRHLRNNQTLRVEVISNKSSLIGANDDIQEKRISLRKPDQKIDINIDAMKHGINSVPFNT